MLKQILSSLLHTKKEAEPKNCLVENQNNQKSMPKNKSCKTKWTKSEKQKRNWKKIKPLRWRYLRNCDQATAHWSNLVKAYKRKRNSNANKFRRRIKYWEIKVNKLLTFRIWSMWMGRREMHKRSWIVPKRIGKSLKVRDVPPCSHLRWGFWKMRTVKTYIGHMSRWRKSKQQLNGLLQPKRIYRSRWTVTRSILRIQSK